jgi:outer membrane protein assembly factor BamA
MRRRVTIWILGCLLFAGAKAQHARADVLESDFSDSLVEKRISQIHITGNKVTRLPIVQREIALKAGETYRMGDLRKRLRLTKEQLMNTTLFVTVHVDTTDVGNDELDVNVEVKERWYIFPVPYFKVIDRNWNVWIKDYKASLDRTNLGIKVSHNNLTGNNDKLNVWVIGGYTQQFSFNYTKPYIDKRLRHGLNTGFVYARNREVNYGTDSNRQQFIELPEFARTYVRADIGYGYRKGSQMRMSAKLSYNHESFDSAVVAMNPNLLGNGRTKAGYVDALYSFQYFNVDYIPYPLRGWQVEAYTFARMGQGMNLVKIGGKALGTWEVMHKTYADFRAVAAISFPGGQPFYNQKLMGYGDLTMRGMEYYVVDGTTAGILKGTLRHEVLHFTIRNLVKSKSHNEIPFRFFLKGYGDLGYAYAKDPGTSYMSNMLLHTWGVGLDVVTVYDLVLKLEYSRNQFGEGGIFIHTAADF